MYICIYMHRVPLEQWFPSFSMHQNHQEGLLETQISGPPPKLLWWGLRICIPNKSPSDCFATRSGTKAVVRSIKMCNIIASREGEPCWLGPQVEGIFTACPSVPFELLCEYITCSETNLRLKKKWGHHYCLEITRDSSRRSPPSPSSSLCFSFVCCASTQCYFIQITPPAGYQSTFPPSKRNPTWVQIAEKYTDKFSCLSKKTKQSWNTVFHQSN